MLNLDVIEELEYVLARRNSSVSINPEDHPQRVTRDSSEDSLHEQDNEQSLYEHENRGQKYENEDEDTAMKSTEGSPEASSRNADDGEDTVSQGGDTTKLLPLNDLDVFPRYRAGKSETTQDIPGQNENQQDVADLKTWTPLEEAPNIESDLVESNHDFMSTKHNPEDCEELESLRCTRQCQLCLGFGAVLFSSVVLGVSLLITLGAVQIPSITHIQDLFQSFGQFMPRDYVWQRLQRNGTKVTENDTEHLTNIILEANDIFQQQDQYFWLGMFRELETGLTIMENDFPILFFSADVHNEDALECFLQFLVRGYRKAGLDGEIGSKVLRFNLIDVIRETFGGEEPFTLSVRRFRTSASLVDSLLSKIKILLEYGNIVVIRDPQYFPLMAIRELLFLSREDFPSLLGGYRSLLIMYTTINTSELEPNPKSEFRESEIVRLTTCGGNSWKQFFRSEVVPDHVFRNAYREELRNTSEHYREAANEQLKQGYSGKTFYLCPENSTAIARCEASLGTDSQSNLWKQWSSTKKFFPVQPLVN